MNLALMQPYLFPYLGSFALIDAADVYVVFDNVQYIRRGWMHRNRIHKPGGGWQYLGVPVQRTPRATLIRDVRLSGSVDWRGRLRAGLEVAYARTAPAYTETMEIVDAVLEPRADHLMDVSVRALATICDALGITFQHRTATQIGLSRPRDSSVSQWAIEACRALGADTYLNPPGGRALYPSRDFEAVGLGLGFVEARIRPYPRAGNEWEPDLSVLDALMFLGMDGTRRALDYRIAPPD